MDALKGWLPISIVRRDHEWRVDWCWFGEAPLTQPFFRDAVDDALRLPFNQAFRRETSLKTLIEWEVPAAQPQAFIYHASRCGSTLLSQMLAQVGDRIVVSEPPALDTLLCADLDDDVRQAALRGLLAAYGQRRSGKERALVVKLDAWNIEQLPLLHACYPNTPWLFVYRNPLEIAASHWRRPGMHMVPGLPGSQRLAAGLSREEGIATRLGQVLRQGAEHCAAYGGVPVNYCELPDAMDGHLADFFALDPVQRQQAFCVVNQHAKQPDQPFVADAQGKQREASDELRDQVQRQCEAAYRQLEKMRTTIR